MGYRPVGAVWIKADKNGKAMLSIKLEHTVPAGTWINGFTNDYKKEDKQPDYKLTMQDETYVPPQRNDSPSSQVPSGQGHFVMTPDTLEYDPTEKPAVQGGLAF